MEPSDDFEILETTEQSLKRTVDEQNKMILTMRNQIELGQSMIKQLESQLQQQKIYYDNLILELEKAQQDYLNKIQELMNELNGLKNQKKDGIVNGGNASQVKALEQEKLKLQTKIEELNQQLIKLKQTTKKLEDQIHGSNIEKQKDQAVDKAKIKELTDLLKFEKNSKEKLAQEVKTMQQQIEQIKQTGKNSSGDKDSNFAQSTILDQGKAIQQLKDELQTYDFIMENAPVELIIQKLEKRISKTMEQISENKPSKSENELKASLFKDEMLNILEQFKQATALQHVKFTYQVN